MNQFTVLPKAITYCFITQILVWGDGNITITLVACDSLIMFSPPIFSVYLCNNVACLWHDCPINRENMGSKCDHPAVSAGNLPF